MRCDKNIFFNLFKTWFLRIRTFYISAEKGPGRTSGSTSRERRTEAKMPRTRYAGVEKKNFLLTFTRV